MVFHAGTKKLAGDGQAWHTQGGRVLGVCAMAAKLEGALDLVYKGVRAIDWQGVHYRKDIGGKAFHLQKQAS